MSGNPKYKLFYFDIRGRGEISRLVFAQAGVPFVDERIAFHDWPKLKGAMPLGTLPVLEMEGKRFGQSLAVQTYLAREFGLYGACNMDSMIIDQVQQQREDLLVALAKVKYAKSDEDKAAFTKSLQESVIPTTFKFFESVIKENRSGSGYAVGDSITLADLVIYEGTQFCVDQKMNVLDNFPLVKSLREKVENSDNIKKYLAGRKKTEF